MSEYKPRPLASYKRTTRLTDLEENFRAATAIVGGSAYSGGVSTGALAGAMGVDQIKRDNWITNDRKTEPYSHLVFQGGIPSLPATGMRMVYVPVGDLLANVVPVAISVRFLAGSATWSGNVNVRICNSSLIQIDCVTTPLTAGQYVTATAATATWTNSSDLAQNNIMFGLSGTTGLVTTGWILTAIFKAKHIA